MQGRRGSSPGPSLRSRPDRRSTRASHSSRFMCPDFREGSSTVGPAGCFTRAARASRTTGSHRAARPGRPARLSRTPGRYGRSGTCGTSRTSGTSRISGTSGTSGTSGASRGAGTTGPPGTTGTARSPGASRAQGPQGLQGPPGPQGGQGPPGPAGGLDIRTAQLIFFAERDARRAREGTVLASAITILPPNAGDRFALTFSGAATERSAGT